MPLATTTTEERTQRKAALDLIEKAKPLPEHERAAYLSPLSAYVFIGACDLKDLKSLEQGLRIWLKENPPSS